MKKLSMLFIIGATMIIQSCSKTDDYQSGYSDAEREALSVLDGTFVYEQTSNGEVISTITIVFSPFKAPTPKISTLVDVSMDFCGIMLLKYDYTLGTINGEDNYYFYLDTSKNRLGAYKVHKKEDYFDAFNGKFYNYEIVDKNTIRLFDTALSNPFFQTETYIRKQ